jgi:hypothetical protein
MNGAGDFVKHKFDMLLLLVVVGLLVWVLIHAGYFHDATLLTWAETTTAGVIGALVNMTSNRTNTNERKTDASTDQTK